MRLVLSTLLLAVLLTACGDEAGAPAWRASHDRVSSLLRDLASDDAAVRKDAAAAVGSEWPSGARAVPVLLAALEDEDEGVREAAATSLERLGHRGCVYLVGFLRDEEDGARRAYVRAISDIHKLGAKIHSGSLAEFVCDSPRAGLVAYALWPLRNAARGPEKQRVFSYIVSWYVDAQHLAAHGLDDPRIAETAAASAALLGLAGLAPSSEREVPGGVLGLLDEDDVVLNFSGEVMLCWLGSTRREVVSALEARIPGEDEEIRSESAWVLHHMGLPIPADAEHLQDLAVGGLHDRCSAGVALSWTGREAAVAVPALRDALVFFFPPKEHHELIEWVNVIRALGRYGDAAKEAVPELQALHTRDSSEFDDLLRLEAAAALCLIDGPDPTRVEILIDGLADCVKEDSDPHDVHSAHQVFQALLAAVEKMESALKAKVAEQAIAILRAEPRPWHALRLSDLLGTLGEDAAGAVPTLVSNLAEAEARWQDLLAGRGPKDDASSAERLDLASIVVRDGFAFDGRIESQIRITDVLGRIGPSARETIPLLERLVREGDDLLRYHAARALRRIRRP